MSREGKGQARIGTGDGNWDKRVPIVLGKALLAGGVRLNRQQ